MGQCRSCTRNCSRPLRFFVEKKLNDQCHLFLSILYYKFKGKIIQTEPGNTTQLFLYSFLVSCNLLQRGSGRSYCFYAFKSPKMTTKATFILAPGGVQTPQPPLIFGAPLRTPLLKKHLHHYSPLLNITCPPHFPSARIVTVCAIFGAECFVGR